MPGKKRAAAAEPPVVVEHDEADFPRGGREDLTPLEKRQLSRQAEADFASELQGDGSADRKKRKKSQSSPDALEIFDGVAAGGGKAAGGRGPQHVEQLKYKTLCVGMKLWGCVLEVSPDGLTVSLPHGLRGSVSPAESSDTMSLMLDPKSRRGAALRAALPGGAAPPLTELFSVGQYVRCSVVGLQRGAEDPPEEAAADAGAGGSRRGPSKAPKRILLSLKLKHLLGGGLCGLGGSAGPEALAKGQVVPAVVASVEDRGYGLSFGVKGATGFLPAKDYAAHYGQDAPLLPGALLDVVVTTPPAAAAGGGGGAATGVVQVTVGHDAVAGGVLHAWEGLTMASLLPGSLVNCKVKQVLADGLLVAFCGFFSGTVDHFHLGAPIPEPDWRQRYAAGQKLQARLLYVDPANKRVGLSCLPHLLNRRLPSAVPQMGQVFEEAVVARVDPGLGLLLRLPMEPEPASGFAHVSNLADGQEQLSKGDVARRFPVGAAVRARVIGFRLVDGLVAMSLKKSVLAQQVYSAKDLFPGQLLEVASLDEAPGGLVVQITPNLKGLVPRAHMADAAAVPEGAKLPSRLRPGKQFAARVLSVDAASRRVLLTAKKGMLGSKLPVLSDLRQAEPGMKAHGVVTGSKDYGVFVGFYGGVAGLLPTAALDLLPGQAPADAYAAGQLLRVQVVSVDPRRGRLVLSLASKKSAEAAAAAGGGAGAGASWGGLGVGSLVPDGGVVRQVLQRPESEGGGVVELTVYGAGGQQVLAHLPTAHLSDHPGGVEALLAVLKPGQVLPGPLLVLQQRRVRPEQRPEQDRWDGEPPASGSDSGEGEEEGDGERRRRSKQQQQQKTKQPQCAGAGEQGEAVPVLLVTRKGSMVAAADKLPSSVGEVAAGAVLPGYVASVTRDAVFVRFLGRCTGRAGLPRLADTFVTDPSSHYVPGQTVIAAVVAVQEGGAAGGRFEVSLKPSAVGVHEGALLGGLLSDLELANRLEQAAEAAAAEEAGEEPPEPIDWGLFPPGRAVAARLHEIRDYGAVVDLDDHPDAVGLVMPDHGGREGAAGLGSEGEAVSACVLDFSKSSGIIELSLLSELTHLAAPVPNAGKKAPKKAAAAAGAGGDQQQQQQQQQPAVGAEVQAVVQLVKEHYVVVSLLQEQQQPQQQQQQGSKQSGKQQQRQQFTGIAFVSRCDYNSQGPAGKEARRFARGQVLSTRVAAAAAPETGGRLLLELSQPLAHGKPGAKGASAVAAAAGGARPSAGGVLSATVVAVHDLELEVVWGKAGTTAHIHVAELQERLAEPPKTSPLRGFRVQQQVTAAWLGHVKGIGHKRGKEPQLSLRPSALAAAREGGDKAKAPPVLGAADLHPGLRVVGWVCGISADALWLTLAPELKGRVHVLESGGEPEQLSVDLEERFSVGQALAAVVLGVDPAHHTLDLSLRPDRLAAATADVEAAAAAAATAAAAAAGGAAAGAAGATLPGGGALVPGRVASVSGSGVVVQLGPKLQGVAALTDLHDGWVANALAGLGVGPYVRARVLAAPGGNAAAGKQQKKGKQQQEQQQQQPLVDGKGRVLLSLRPSDGGLVGGWREHGQGEQGQPEEGGAAAAGKDGLLNVQELKPGSQVQGYVRSVSTKGLFVVLDRARDARVKLSQLSDGFVDDPSASFPVGSRVRGRVLSVERTKPPGAEAAAEGAPGGAARLADDGVRLELSLRSGEAQPGLRQLSDIKEGELTSGKVRRVERYGVFVELARSRVVGLAHVSQLGKGFVKDPAAHFSPGQVVAVRVTAVDVEARKVTLSMDPELLAGGEEEEEEGRQGAGGARRPADFDDALVEAMEVDGGSGSGSEEEEEHEDEDEEGSEEEDEDEEGSEEEEEEGQEGAAMDDMELSGSEEEDEEEDEEGSEGLEPGAAAAVLSGPAAAAAADWGELQLDGEAAAGGEQPAANGTAELTRAQKKRLKAQREAEVMAAERARVSGVPPPESASAYEQQLLAEPNSGELWVKFMAFQLKLGEVDAARRVGERALATIAMTAEEDKFRVWAALLNLENSFGGPNAEEALMALFKRAVQYVDAKRLYLTLLTILETSGRHQLAAEVWRTATKKFNGSCKVWLGAFESALQAARRHQEDDAEGGGGAGAADGGAAARQVLERALKSLPKHKHIKALTRAALAEFRLGCPERGRSILEGVLANYPKRTDLWNVYVDQEIKAGDMARTRALLSRATSLSLPPKKMKVLFRRWMEFEQAHGSAADVAAVRQRAAEYVQSLALGGS